MRMESFFEKLKKTLDKETEMWYHIQALDVRV